MLKNVYQHIMISIHPLRGEWDALPFWKRKKEWLFQSTHSVGSGTQYLCLGFGLFVHFNPPTPWGVGLKSKIADVENGLFQSTHSVGSGTEMTVGVLPTVTFQSTHSVGSGT